MKAVLGNPIPSFPRISQVVKSQGHFDGVQFDTVGQPHQRYDKYGLIDSISVTEN